MAAYTQSMAALDPNSGQLVEVAIDPNSTYFVQDSGEFLTGSQIQMDGLQGGKSVLKPELAQHLVQPAGFKTSIARGGFTQSIVDPRMTQSVQRGSRVLPKKSGTTSGLQVIGMSASNGLIQHSAARAPTASGLLSLGTRYTPSSGSLMGIGQSGAAGGMITGVGGLNNSSSLVSGAQGANMFASASMMSERDAGYRIAAAMAGSSNRGRPRGRRPLRGQFPVVPIDMVRQLGIEQQVILQPAAPVAMRNKAILCRPLSVSRKTQSGVQESEFSCQTTESTKIYESPVKKKSRRFEEEEEEEDTIILQPELESVLEEMEECKKSEQHTVETGSIPSVSSDAESEIETVLSPSVSKLALKSFDANSTQTDENTTIMLGTQTDEEPCPTKTADFAPQFLPIPIPVPIYIPVPVYLYARPVPYAVPFPLPCVIPLPLVIKEDAEKGEASENKTETVPEDISSILKLTAKQQPNATDIHQASQKRPASRESLIGPFDAPCQAKSREYVDQPLRKRSRTQADDLSRASIPIDSNYRLKFSYGINAWRSWVNRCSDSQNSMFADLLNLSDENLNLALSRFVREVRKPNNERYLEDSIFYFCLGIQEYLNESGRPANLFCNSKFASFSQALDNVIADFQPRINENGLLICRIEEEHLWEAKLLGTDSPQILLFSLVYFITKHFYVRTCEDHRELTSADFEVKTENETTVLCFSSRNSVISLERLDRCPVRLFQFYLDKCPPDSIRSGGPLYLTPLPDDKLSSKQWFSSIPVNSSSLQVMLNLIKIVKEVQEEIMNSHSD